MPPRIQRLMLPSSPPQIQKSHTCQCVCQMQARNFSSTDKRNTRLRGNMYRWLNGPGEVFRKPLPGSTNYLNAYDQMGNLVRAPQEGSSRKKQESRARSTNQESNEEDTKREETQEPPEMKNPSHVELPAIPKETAEDLMPFPMNRQFRSQAVLSEDLKNAIWKRVMEDGKSVRDVSALLGVEMRRVAAVIRLKAVEKEWEKQGKPLATPYAKAVQSMLPQTPYIPNDPVIHESINDLPVHRATERQVFHPVSESRHFTRRDAGIAFDRTLLPAEDRVPHPELVQLEKWKHEGLVTGERIEKQRAANEMEESKRKERIRRERAREAQEVTKAETSRSVFRFQDISAETVGHDGRDRRGIGARYGIPHQDRKKGQIKIPVRVE